MRFVVRPVVIVAFALAGLSSAHAQIESREGIALQNQIYQLRAQLQALQEQSGRGGPNRPPTYLPQPQQPQYTAPGGDLLPQLLTRVDNLEDQVRQLRGRIDELQNQVQQQNADLGKRIDDLAFQMSPQGNPQGRQSSAPAQSPAAPPAPTPAPSASRTPETILQEGNAALARRDYASAEAAARQVLSNKVSPKAYDANLLLAQALAGERQYSQAAIAFDDTYNRSRKGSHAQDALLGLATSLNAINERKASCDTLAKLRAEFPQMRTDIRDAAGALSQKANCR
jgi:TolA-binding protein